MQFESFHWLNHHHWAMSHDYSMHDKHSKHAHDFLLLGS